MLSQLHEMFGGTEETLHHNVPLSQYMLTDAHVMGHLPITELKVPMCCNKCEEKVKEELKELDGVHDLVCDRTKQKVTVAGHVDPFLALKQAKKVNRKSDFFPSASKSSTPLCFLNAPTTYTIHGYVYGTADHNAAGLTRSNSIGRNLGRLPSFGKVVHYEAPYLDHHRYDHFRDDPHWDSCRDYYGVRRMPSFDRYQYHDAEFISVDDYQPPPSYWEPQYAINHCLYPVYRSQVSFSKLPVMNPYYVKPIIPSEY